MIISISYPVDRINIPNWDGAISMIPFDLRDITTLPLALPLPAMQVRRLVQRMIQVLPLEKHGGTAFLTIDARTIPCGETHRRGGVHIDGNYLGDTVSMGWGKETKGWGGWKEKPHGKRGWDNPSSTPDWKIDGVSKKLDIDDHMRSYQSHTGGMLIASDYPACKGWIGCFLGIPQQGGDCSHIDLSSGHEFKLHPNVVYYGNSQFVHESIPVDKEIHRTLVRITLPEDYPTLIQ